MNSCGSSMVQAVGVAHSIIMGRRGIPRRRIVPVGDEAGAVGTDEAGEGLALQRRLGIEIGVEPGLKFGEQRQPSHASLRRVSRTAPAPSTVLLIPKVMMFDLYAPISHAD